MENNKNQNPVDEEESNPPITNGIFQFRVVYTDPEGKHQDALFKARILGVGEIIEFGAEVGKLFNQIKSSETIPSYAYTLAYMRAELNASLISYPVWFNIHTLQDPKLLEVIYNGYKTIVDRFRDKGKYEIKYIF